MNNMLHGKKVLVMGWCEDCIGIIESGCGGTYPFRVRCVQRGIIFAQFTATVAKQLRIFRRTKNLLLL